MMVVLNISKHILYIQLYFIIYLLYEIIIVMHNMYRIVYLINLTINP